MKDVNELISNFHESILREAGDLSAKIKENGGDQARRATLYICVDALTRRYGGPEEGGWWYDAGEVISYESVRVSYTDEGNPTLSEGEKDFLRELASEWLEDFEFGTAHRNSVRPRANDFAWRVTEGVPEDWSNYRPYC